MVLPSSFHVKLKREKVTVFVECQDTDTVGVLKQKLGSMLNRPPKELRLLWKDQPLDDGVVLTAAGIALDSIIPLVYWNTNEEGKCLCYAFSALSCRVDATKSGWEPTPQVIPFPSMKEDAGIVGAPVSEPAKAVNAPASASAQ